MSSQKLILIKHAMPEIIHGVTANRWALSEQGHTQSIALANRLSGYAIDRIITSREPKAAETGQIVADHLHCPCSNADNLHEHDRSNVTTFDNPVQFEAHVANFFAQPDQLVYGLETAATAYQRFSAAIKSVLESYPQQTLGIVAHGTVITLLVARHANIEPFAFWRRLDLPSFVVLSQPDWRLLEVVEHIA